MEFKVNLDFSVFIALLSVAFIVLKILNYITWSWIWVLSPIWISTLVFAILFSGVMIRKNKWK